MQRTFVFFAGAAILTACVTPRTQRDSQLAPQPAWEATLVSSEGRSLHGTVIVTPLLDDETGLVLRSRVTVSLSGATPGSSHAWHIHRGSCGTDGPIVGPAASYTPVPIGSGGAAQLITEMPIRLTAGGSYFAHVHDAAATGVEACGALHQAGAVLVTR